MAKDMSNQYRSPETIMESLEDNRLQEVLSRDYDFQTDVSYDDDLLNRAKLRAGTDNEKVSRVYQELKRTIDGLKVINDTIPDKDNARQMMDSFIYLQNFKIESILHPNEQTLPSTE